MSSLIHITDLTHTVAKIYYQNWKAFLGVLLWLLIPTALVFVEPALPLGEQGGFVFVNALAVITILVSLWLSVLLVDMFLGYTHQKPHIRNRAGKPQGVIGRIIDLVLVSVLQGIVVGVWFLPWIIPGFIAYYQGLEASIAAVPYLFLAGLVLLVPGLLLANWFSFARYAVLVSGNSPGTEAFRASRKLVIGRFWKIAWRWIGAYLYFGSLLLLGLAALLTVIGALTGTLGEVFSAKPVWWVELISNVVTVLATPLFIGVGVLLYTNAKQTK